LSSCGVYHGIEGSISLLRLVFFVEISPRAQCHNDMTSEVIRYLTKGSE
jgi:hypothetical protein